MVRIKSNKETASSLANDIYQAADNCGTGATKVVRDNETTVSGNKNAGSSIQTLGDLLVEAGDAICKVADNINKIADDFEETDQNIGNKISK